MDAAIAKQALDKYLAQARERDISPASLEKRQRFLERLIELVADDSFSPAMYRIAVARVLPEFSRGGETMLYKATAREFSHFLADAEGAQKPGLGDADAAHAPEVQIDPPESMDRLLEDATARSWYVTHLGRLERQVRDLRNLERYLQSQRESGVSSRLVEHQGRLLGGMLYLLAPHHGNALTYRAGVSAMLNLLSDDDNQQRDFVEIAREFYYFWLEDPDNPHAEAEAGSASRAASSAH